MYKRKDWLLFHGQDGGDSSSDDESSESEASESGSDDSGSGSEATSSGSDAESSGSEELASGDEADHSAGGPPVGGDKYTRPLEELSEGDYSDEDVDEERLEQLAQQLKGWMEAPKGTNLKGKAVKCIVCNGTLVLNSSDFKTHVSSKKHLKNIKAAIEDDSSDDDLQPYEPFCFAEDFDPSGEEEEEEAETHFERLERLRGILAKENNVVAGGEGGNEEDSDDDSNKEDDQLPEEGKKVSKKLSNKEKKLKRKEKRSKGKEKEARKRPGKRQRQALKEERVKSGDEKKGGKKKTKEGVAVPATKKKQKKST